MKKLANWVFMLAAVALLAACSDGMSPPAVLDRAQPIGSPFTKYLAIEYKTVANRFHGTDATYFARKGLAAVDGVLVQPERLEGKDIAGPQAAEMAEARGDLITLLNDGGRDRAPDVAAVAQTRFDCWLTLYGGTFLHHREVRFPDENIPCKEKFYKAMDLLKQELAVAPPPVMAPPAPPAPPVEEFPSPIVSMPRGAETPVDEMAFVIFFDWDRYTITPGAYDVVQQALHDIKDHGDIKRIDIDGYTDTSGGEEYNMKLSMKRARAVRDLLVKHGVSSKKIRLVGHGEHDLLVKTPKGVREPQNRRAQITFE